MNFQCCEAPDWNIILFIIIQYINQILLSTCNYNYFIFYAQMRVCLTGVINMLDETVSLCKRLSFWGLKNLVCLLVFVVFIMLEYV